MRNLLFMLTIVLVSITASAQKLNSRGEKMVSKIDVQSCNFRTGEMRKGDTYTFRYNDNNQIVGLSVKYKDEGQRITKNGNNLTREYFYGKKDEEKSIKYEYLLDESGNIIQKSYYDGVGDPLTVKDVWNFMYRYDEFSGRCIVDSVSYFPLYRDIQSGMRDYDFVDGESEPFTLKVKREKGGLYYNCRFGAKSYWQAIEDRVEYALGLVDDTNINLNFLWGGAPCTMGGDTNRALEFLVPEWVNAKSGYLYSDDPEFEYVPTKDKKGNIIRIEQVSKINGKLKRVFTITYR